MIVNGDARSLPLADESVQCCVTSPPYWGLRDYGVAGQIGLERTPEEYVAVMVAVFREVRRVLKKDGTCWLNLGDSYCSTDKWGGGKSGNTGKHSVDAAGGVPSWAVRTKRDPIAGLKPKDLVGIPWRVAFALQADGWWLRMDVIWNKPNPMPESVTDRPTRSHEYLFLLTKAARYYYDAAAIAEPMSQGEKYHGDYSPNTGSGPKRTTARNGRDKQRGHSRRHAGFNDRWDAMERAEQCSGMRNRRSVWTIATQPYSEAHFATFPEKLVEPCVLAGSRAGDIVLDPFAGSGTVGKVCTRFGRQFVGVELNPAYIEMAGRRGQNVQTSLLMEDC